MSDTGSTAAQDAAWYFDELRAHLEDRGAESHVAARAIVELEDGLQDGRNALERYGPSDELADAVMEAFSIRGRHYWTAMRILAAGGLYVLMVVAFHFTVEGIEADRSLVFTDGGQQLPFRPGDRVLSWTSIVMGSIVAVMVYLGLRGDGALLRNDDGRSQTSLGRWPPSMGMLRYFGTSVAVFLALLGLRWVFPPNYGDDYLVAPSTLWIAGIAALVVGTTAGLSCLRHRRVALTGDAKYLVRVPADKRERKRRPYLDSVSM